jgi:Fur family ferric uptake transcriptional regulator
MSRLEELVQKFKQRGYKMTPQRRAILEALTKNVSHPTAEEIHETVRARMPDISLATVYNTLRDLAEMEELWGLDLGHGVRYYEISREDHAHRVCLVCGRLDDVPGDFGKVNSLFRCGDDFRPVRCAVTIYGYCAGCALSLDAEE